MEQNIIMKTNNLALFAEYELWSKIHIIRGVQVMLDFDLAAIYGYETRRFNEQVKNNIERYHPEPKLSSHVFLRCNFFTLKNGRGQHSKYLPYVFTRE